MATKKPTKRSKKPSKTATNPTQDSYSATEAARIIGVSPRRIRQLVDEGKLKPTAFDPLRVLSLDVLAIREERQEAETARESLPTPPASQKITLTQKAYIEALQEARNQGSSETRLVLEAVSNEIRDRADRAEQRAATAEAKLLETASTLEVLKYRLVELETKKTVWRRLFGG